MSEISQEQHPRTLTLFERLNAARHSRFVGRTEEIKLFESAIRAYKSTLLSLDAATEIPFHILHIFGPGGVGKTTLLSEYTRICKQAQIQTIYIDARNIEPTSESFLNALRFVMNLAPNESPIQVLAAEAIHILLIDTYETLAPLDEWLREVFLPQLPANTLVVLAGRHSPSAAWRADPGWQTLLHILPLRNLNPEESRIYLTKRQIPTTEHGSILDFTYGYPLALSLIADVFAHKGDIHFQPDAVPDVIKALLEKFVQRVPSPAHRMALEACALVRLTTETLLARMLGLPDVHELFEWLRGLSFIEPGQLGLFPHDLAREVLIADLRWRNPDWYIELHGRARTYYTSRLGQTQGQEQHRILFDYIFLHRDNPAVRPRFTWQENSTLLTDKLRPTDPPALLEMVTQHEGEASANLLAHWLQRQPEGVLVFRAEQQPVGFVMMVALHQARSEDLRVDPAASSAWHYLSSSAPLRTGEGATLFRFWMARDTYQSVSPIQSLIFINFVQHHRLTAGLAFTFFACAEPEDWAAMFAYADLARIPEADFEVGGQRYGVYGHDWRVLPPKAWQAMLAQREIAASAQAIQTSTLNESLVVLSQAEFVKAVREALQDFSRPDALQRNPLLRSRLVMEQVAANANDNQPTAALQSLIQAAAQSLESSPRQAKSYRALYHTYLHPAPTQEQAAELLDLPFSTFRRHLKNGMTRVAEILWLREIS
jgi:hypothetical protein